jgi:hypothetical protein
LKLPRVTGKGEYLEALEIERLEAEGGTLMTQEIQRVKKWKTLRELDQLSEEKTYFTSFQKGKMDFSRGHEKTMSKTQ